MMIDTFGVPEYYSDRIGDIEDAGNGMIRVVRCIERHGVLIPVFSLVTPAIAMLRTSRASGRWRTGSRDWKASAATKGLSSYPAVRFPQAGGLFRVVSHRNQVMRSILPPLAAKLFVAASIKASTLAASKAG
jgi:hypothetical protein